MLQTIRFPDPGSHQYPETRLTLAACATSGLPVKYEITDLGGDGRMASCPEWVKESRALALEVHRPPTGCRITAIQEGNAQFARAQVSRKWTVDYLAVTVGLEGKQTLVYTTESTTIPVRVTAIHPIPTFYQTYNVSGDCEAPSPSGASVSETKERNKTFPVVINLHKPASGSGTCRIAVTVGANALVWGKTESRTYDVVVK